MKKPYSLLLALGVVAASLSSCSRTDYAFNPKAPAYLGTTRAVAAPPVASAVPEGTAPEITVVAPAAPAVLPAPATEARLALQVQTAAAQTAAAPVKATKPSLVQRLAVKKILKQVAKAESRQQNTASTTHAAATGGSLTVAIVGLAALVVGLIVSSGFLITVGSIVLVIGLVLFVLKAL